jgi:hypothetical protein
MSEAVDSLKTQDTSQVTIDDSLNVDENKTTDPERKATGTGKKATGTGKKATAKEGENGETATDEQKDTAGTETVTVKKATGTGKKATGTGTGKKAGNAKAKKAKDDNEGDENPLLNNDSERERVMDEELNYGTVEEPGPPKKKLRNIKC